MMHLDNKQVDILKSIAHPIRLKIIKNLMNGPLCVCDLNENIDFSQSNLSQHLKILKNAHIIIQQRDGNKINYSIKDKDIIILLDIVQKLAFKEFQQ